MIGDCKVCGKPLPEEHVGEYCGRRCVDIEKRMDTPRKNKGKL